MASLFTGVGVAGQKAGQKENDERGALELILR
jgi:hypothetical protein